MAALNHELKVLEDLYDEGSPDVNLKRLAKLLGLQDKELAKALKISGPALSRKPYAPQNEGLNEWIGIFNLVIKVITEADQSVPPEHIKLQMQRWLKLARPEFNNKTPIEYMVSGKSRRVRNFLEQQLTD